MVAENSKGGITFKKRIKTLKMSLKIKNWKGRKRCGSLLRLLIDNTMTFLCTAAVCLSVTGCAQIQICVLGRQFSLTLYSDCIFRSRVFCLLTRQRACSTQTACLCVTEVRLWLIVVLGGDFGVDLANLLQGAG